MLQTVLIAHGYEVAIVTDGQAALERAALWQPDAIILDLGLPGLDGLEVCREIRAWSHVPIIVLTVRDSEAEKVMALDLGADDYLTKPFGMDELLARIRVALRHTALRAAAAPALLTFGELQLDRAGRRVTLGGRAVHLTPTEYALLTLLAENAGRVLTHRVILARIWGPSSSEDVPTLRVFITQLRRKIEPDPSQPIYILTEPGIGYRFQPQE